METTPRITGDAFCSECDCINGAGNRGTHMDYAGQGSGPSVLACAFCGHTSPPVTAAQAQAQARPTRPSVPLEDGHRGPCSDACVMRHREAASSTGGGARERAKALLAGWDCNRNTRADLIGTVAAELARLDAAREVALADAEKWRDVWKKNDAKAELAQRLDWALAEQKAWFESAQKHEAERDEARKALVEMTEQRDVALKENRTRAALTRGAIGAFTAEAGDRRGVEDERDAALARLEAVRRAMDGYNKSGGDELGLLLALEEAVRPARLSATDTLLDEAVALLQEDVLSGDNATELDGYLARVDALVARWRERGGRP